MPVVDLEQAVSIIKNGGIVAYPTESSYALAVDIFNIKAVENLFSVKVRARNQPVGLLVATLSMIGRLTPQVSEDVQIVDRFFWPGPLNVIIAAASVLQHLNPDFETVSVRVPDNKVARALSQSLGQALPATSANPSGKEPAFDHATLETYFGDAIDGILSTDVLAERPASTIVDLTQNPPILVRSGTISFECIVKKLEMYSVVDCHQAGGRVDVFLNDTLENSSRAHVQRLISHGAVELLQGENAPVPVKKPGAKTRCGRYFINEPTPIASVLTPTALDLDIVFEDDVLLVVNKAQGMVVHPGAGTDDRTLVHGLLAHCKNLPGIGGVERPGIVHRIDKETSGLLVVAKTEHAHRHLSAQFKDHSTERCYFALAFGVPKLAKGRFHSFLGRHLSDRKRFASVAPERGKEAITHYCIEKKFAHCSLLRIHLETGRTHQIRVHLRENHHFIIGDRIYGLEKRLKQDFPGLFKLHQQLPGQFLHAGELGFIHPVTEQAMMFRRALPPQMQIVLEQLKEIT